MGGLLRLVVSLLRLSVLLRLVTALAVAGVILLLVVVPLTSLLVAVVVCVATIVVVVLLLMVVTVVVVVVGSRLVRLLHVRLRLMLRHLLLRWNELAGASVCTENILGWRHWLVLTRWLL